MAKKALLVGLNQYPAPVHSLRGCLNDVSQVHDLISSRLGFAARDIVTLTDSRATTRRLVAQLGRLVDGASPGDVLLFHYSGHGSQVDDQNGDETDDRLDGIICPYDLDWDHPFSDDDLYEIVEPLPAGVNLTVVLDCCHSGTGLREARPERAEPDRATQRCIASPKAAHIARRGTPTARRFGAKAAARGAILIAACRADQVAADAFIDRDYHGALTYYLCRALEEAGWAPSYSALIHRVRELLRLNGYDQLPQLEGHHALLRRPVFSAAAETAAS